jgi:hypothetical protein|tara:strand:- start:366 stop:665 length:300 start_codon:yes stop_codon:yes gene_type:complete
MQVGDTIELKGKSKHGKNRIQQFGTEWLCIKISERIHTSKHQRLAGPFAMLVSMDLEDLRWIAVKDDPDFIVDMLVSSTGDLRWIAVKDDPDFIVEECV